MMSSLALFLSLSASTLPAVDCDWPRSGSDNITCARVAADSADADLQQAFKQLREIVDRHASATVDFGPASIEQIESVLSSFDDAQSKWAAFRTAECQAVAKFMVGNDHDSVTQFQCRAQLTIERSKYVRALVAPFLGH